MLGHWLTWYVIGIVLVLVVLIASLVPSSELPSVNLSDKTEHFVAYGGLALWFGGLTERGNYPKLFLWLLVLGGGIEIAQGLMRLGRQAEWLDLVADGVGAAAGLLLCLAGLRHWAGWVEHWTRER